VRALRGHGGIEPGHVLGDRQAGIPEMRKRGYSPGFARGSSPPAGTLGILLPPSITMILYSVRRECRWGACSSAGIGPGICWSRSSPVRGVRFRREYRTPTRVPRRRRRAPRTSTRPLTLRQKVEMLPRVLPFVILLIGVMVRSTAAIATPSETAGLGAVLALVLIASIYRCGGPDLAPILARRSRVDHADAHHRHVAAVLLRDELPAHQPERRAVDRRAAPVRSGCCSRDPRLVLVLGFFLPPVIIILMTAPIILPPLKAAGFDLIWFGVLMTIVMEMGLSIPRSGSTSS
jgi:TRAP-type C4-dicarboxylate transport system permease large subunit